MSATPLVRSQPFGTPSFGTLLDEYGIIASVLGLAVGLVGLGLSFWTLWNVLRVRRLARETVRRVGLGLLAEEIGRTLCLVAEARDAAVERRWERCIDRSQEARHTILPLAQSRYLGEDEKGRFAAAEDDLRRVALYVELNRLRGEVPTDPLPHHHRKRLDDLVALLGAIQGRLRDIDWEV